MYFFGWNEFFFFGFSTNIMFLVYARFTDLKKICIVYVLFNHHIKLMKMLYRDLNREKFQGKRYLFYRMLIFVL